MPSKKKTKAQKITWICWWAFLFISLAIPSHVWFVTDIPEFRLPIGAGYLGGDIEHYSNIQAFQMASIHLFINTTTFILAKIFSRKYSASA
jgi:hypothetical protein